MCFGPDCSSIQQTSDGCASEWWKNLLYISNFGKGTAGEDFGTVMFFHIYLFQTNIHSTLFPKFISVHWTNLVLV